MLLVLASRYDPANKASGLPPQKPMMKNYKKGEAVWLTMVCRVISLRQVRLINQSVHITQLFDYLCGGITTTNPNETKI
jgi:hypothetical protein